MDNSSELGTTFNNPFHIETVKESDIQPNQAYFVRFGGTDDPWGYTTRMNSGELLDKIQMLASMKSKET